MLSGKEDPDQNSEQGRTVKKIAEIAGVSHDTIFKVEKIDEKAPEEIKQKIKDGKITINKAYSYIKGQEIRKQREQIAKTGKDVTGDKRWSIACADLNTYKTIKNYDFIITDPPYSRQYLPLYDLLGNRAKQWLKDSGLLVVMCGQSYLNQIIKILDLHLSYYWTACYQTPGQPTPLRQKQVNSTWKPLLIYSKNNSYKGKIFGDVFKSDASDKDFHKWGQSVSGMYSIISGICLPGQTIFDPFAGAGTTGIAALMHGCLFDGIDILQDNVNIAKSRLNDI
jgi:DNA modification methylase